jgi:hypothetical protein
LSSFAVFFSHSSPPGTKFSAFSTLGKGAGCMLYAEGSAVHVGEAGSVLEARRRICYTGKRTQNAAPRESQPAVAEIPAGVGGRATAILVEWEMKRGNGNEAA